MARLPAGMYKQKDGLIQYRFTINNSGSSHRVAVYGKTKKEVLEKAEKRRREIEKQGYKSGKVQTLGEYYAKWEDRRTGTVKAASQVSSGRYFRMIDTTPIDKAGDVVTAFKLDRIEVQALRDLQVELSKKYCTASVNKCLGLIRQLFQAAMIEKLVTWNPAEGVKNLRETETPARETIHRALSVEETKAFFEAAQSSWYYNLFVFLINTGLRAGEAGALRPSDIYDNTIHIRRTITRNRVGQYIMGDDTKTGAGIRDVPLTAAAREAVEAQMKLNREVFGDSDQSNIVSFPGTEKEEKTIFRTQKGLLLYVNHLSRELTRICKRAGIEKVTAHAFRDTFATRAIEGGMNPRTLQEILGHADIGITMNLYVHVMDSTKREQMDALKFHIS